MPTPKPTGTEVLLKVLAAGVCHSDLHLSDGYFDLGGGKKLSLRRPRHEAAGDARPRERRRGGGGRAATRKASRSATAGWSHPWIGCGDCAVCKRGDEQLCTQAEQPRRVLATAATATHLMVPHPRYLFDIGDLPPERAAPLACSGVTTYSALKKVGPTLTTDPTVIIGAGGLGLMCLALHKAMGGHSAIVVDIDPAKREAAKKAGAAAGDRRRARPMRRSRSSPRPTAAPGR